MDDDSWIQEQERLENINQNYYREPMDAIRCVFLYINANLYIEKISHEKIFLEPMLENIVNRVLKKDSILNCLESKVLNKYELDDILLYNVIIEPNQIQMLANSNNDIVTPFLNKCKLDDILIPPSIFIFHNVNTVYFLLKEKKVELSIPKSILKSAISKGKNTKKVRIIDHLEDIKNKKKHRITRKAIPK